MTRGLQRWLPRTLFGRLMLVLASGLMVAQLLSAFLNLAERDRLLAGSFGQQPAQRIADVVALLDGMSTPERQALAAVLRVPPLVLSLPEAPALPAEAATQPQAQMFAARLQAALGEARAVRVVSRDEYDDPRSAEGRGPRWRPREQEPDGVGPRTGRSDAARVSGGAGPGAMPMDHGRRHPRSGPPVLSAEVQLRDGRWARFDARLPPAPQTLPVQLALTLAVLLAGVLAVSFVAVRWVVRPLQQLTRAAETLGEDLDRPPLPEDDGPREVQQAAHAFNTMQRRLSVFVHDRTRLLAALSHDLKTPLTRMRLRAELLDDDELRTRFEADLREMEAMVTHTLEFLRGLGGHEPREPVDVQALLESMQSDQEAMGHTLRLEGQVSSPLISVASLLKRAVGNLVDNAVAYGGDAHVLIEDTPTQLLARVRPRARHPSRGAGTGLRALLPPRSLTQPRHRRHWPGPGHRPQHRPHPGRRRGAAQPA
jgi:HAMP domain-containing protein